jgi:hypothetical protein
MLLSDSIAVRAAVCALRAAGYDIQITGFGLVCLPGLMPKRAAYREDDAWVRACDARKAEVLSLVAPFECDVVWAEDGLLLCECCTAPE